jgi:hypothetical protein
MLTASEFAPSEIMLKIVLPKLSAYFLSNMPTIPVDKQVLLDSPG